MNTSHLVEPLVIGGCIGAARLFQELLRCQMKREHEKKKRGRQASFLEQKSGFIEDMPPSERERLNGIFQAYWSKGRQFGFQLKDGRSVFGSFSPLTDDYLQFVTFIQPPDFETVCMSIPINAVALDTLEYLDFDADDPEWHRFEVAARQDS